MYPHTRSLRKHFCLLAEGIICLISLTTKISQGCNHDDCFVTRVGFGPTNRAPPSPQKQQQKLELIRESLVNARGNLSYYAVERFFVRVFVLELDAAVFAEQTVELIRLPK